MRAGDDDPFARVVTPVSSPHLHRRAGDGDESTPRPSYDSFGHNEVHIFGALLKFLPGCVLKTHTLFVDLSFRRQIIKQHTFGLLSLLSSPRSHRPILCANSTRPILK